MESSGHSFTEGMEYIEQPRKNIVIDMVQRDGTLVELPKYDVDNFGDSYNDIGAVKRLLYLGIGLVAAFVVLAICYFG